MVVSTYVHDGDWLCTWITQILDHVLDQHGALGDLTRCDGCQYGGGVRLGGGGYHLRTELSMLSELRSFTVCCACSSSAIVIVDMCVVDVVVLDAVLMKS